MKKRIEISVDAIESTLDGVEMSLETNLAMKIFVRSGVLFASISGVPEVMAIRKMSIQDYLDWLLIDFNEHDEIHRVAILFRNADWDQVEARLKLSFQNSCPALNRRRTPG